MPGPRRFKKRDTGFDSSWGSKGCTSSMGMPARSRKITWMARSARLSRERTVAPNNSAQRAAVASASVTAREMCASPVGFAIRPPLEGLGRLEHAEHRAQAIRDLAERGPGFYRRKDERHEILVAARAVLERRERALVRRLVAPGAESAQPLGALSLDAHVGLEDLGRLGLVFDEAIDAHDHGASGFHVLLVAVGRHVDLVLHVTRLDGGEHAAAPLDLFEIAARLGFQLVGEGFQEMRAAHRVDGQGHAALVRDYLLRAKC